MSERYVELWPITKVLLYDNNPRIHDAAIDALARSIESYGFQNPILVDEEGVIIAGHARLKAAQKLSMSDVPVFVVRGLTPEQVIAYRLADNRTSNFAQWDTDLLKIELDKLSDEAFAKAFKFDELFGAEMATRDFVDGFFNADTASDSQKHKTSKTITCPNCQTEFEVP